MPGTLRGARCGCRLSRPLETGWAALLGGGGEVDDAATTATHVVGVWFDGGFFVKDVFNVEATSEWG